MPASTSMPSNFQPYGYGKHTLYNQNQYQVYQQPSTQYAQFNNPSSDAQFAQQIGNIMNSSNMPPKYHTNMPSQRHSMVQTPLGYTQPNF